MPSSSKTDRRPAPTGAASVRSQICVRARPALLAKEDLVRKQLQLHRSFGQQYGTRYVGARSEMTVKWQAIGSGYAAIIYEGRDRYFSRRSGGETGMATQRMATFVKVNGRWLLESLNPSLRNRWTYP